MKDVEEESEEEEDDGNEELQRQVRKNNRDVGRLQEMFNSNAVVLEQLQATIRNLEGRNQELLNQNRTLQGAANIIQTPVDGREKLRFSTLSKYDGTPGKLKGFLIQLKNYHNFHRSNFRNKSEKVLHASALLDGKALQWFEPFLENYWQNETLEDCNTETRDIFDSFEGFEHALKSLFQDPDERSRAERELNNLRQTKSAIHYAAEFRRLCATLDMTDESKIFIFYSGLKDEVKDEIVKLDKPEDFLSYTELAIKIDNRLYERRREKGERRQPANSAKKYQWQPQKKFHQHDKNRSQQNQQRSTAYGHHSGPIDLSVANKDNRWNQKPQQKKEFKCYNCDKPGHMARDCRQPKRIQGPPRQASVAQKQRDHSSEKWTNCFNDLYNDHREAKENSRWYPKDPSGRSGCDTTGMNDKILAVADRQDISFFNNNNRPLDRYEQEEVANKLNKAFADGTIVNHPGLLWDSRRLTNYTQVDQVTTPDSFTPEEIQQLEDENDQAIRRLDEAIGAGTRATIPDNRVTLYLTKKRNERVLLQGNTRGQYALQHRTTRFVPRDDGDAKNTRTLAVASKIERKTIEQLDEMLQNQRLNASSTYQDNERRIARLQQGRDACQQRAQQDPSNPTWQQQTGALDAQIERRISARDDPERIHRINQELEEINKIKKEEINEYNPEREQRLQKITQHWHFGISESPYQSEEPDQIEDDYVDATPQDVVSIDDTSSEEDQERQDRIRHLTEILQYQEIDPYDDNQQLYFFGIPAKKRKTYFESSIQANDHPILDPRAKKHYDLFWGQCIIDSCELHVVNKHEYKFYPRRWGTEPITQVYTEVELPMWDLVRYEKEEGIAIFAPNCEYPMRCQHDRTMSWEECTRDICKVHCEDKSRAWRLSQQPSGPSKEIPDLAILRKNKRKGKKSSKNEQSHS
ncbi:reverse transcriptase domain protein [Colletotrichum truncatum]|uniref:Reverse transcriptase domain protein n=1 Tax=Colletotrichum truncatum TaxID=5467 RepID=A0ACC3YDT9_COLTU